MIKRKLYTTPEVIVTKFEVNKNMMASLTPKQEIGFHHRKLQEETQETFLTKVTVDFVSIGEQL